MVYTIERRRLLGLGLGWGATVLGGGLLAACGRAGTKRENMEARRSATGPSGAPVRGGTLVFSDTEAVPSWHNQKLSSYSAGNLTFFEEAQTFGASPNVHVTFQTQTYPDLYNAWKVS